MREKYEMGHEKVKDILVNVNYMCVCFLDVLRGDV